MEKFNPMRAQPVTAEEFDNAVRILAAMSPPSMVMLLMERPELRRISESASAKFSNSVKSSNLEASRHKFEPGDLHPDTCAVCGKFKAWKMHDA